jgi:hypothetical protein
VWPQSCRLRCLTYVSCSCTASNTSSNTACRAACGPHQHVKGCSAPALIAWGQCSTLCMSAVSQRFSNAVSSLTARTLNLLFRIGDWGSVELLLSLRQLVPVRAAACTCL